MKIFKITLLGLCLVVLSCIGGTYGSVYNYSARYGEEQVCTMCENGIMRISCPFKDYVIHVTKANYGRTCSTPTCSESEGAIITHSCIAENSVMVVKEACELQIGCEIPVTNEVFGRDPCIGTIKYLQVKYLCITCKDPEPSRCEHSKKSSVKKWCAMLAVQEVCPHLCGLCPKTTTQEPGE